LTQSTPNAAYSDVTTGRTCCVSTENILTVVTREYSAGNKECSRDGPWVTNVKAWSLHQLTSATLSPYLLRYRISRTPIAWAVDHNGELAKTATNKTRYQGSNPPLPSRAFRARNSFGGPVSHDGATARSAAIGGVSLVSVQRLKIVARDCGCRAAVPDCEVAEKVMRILLSGT
jgi:hypothetical protein